VFIYRSIMNGCYIDVWEEWGEGDVVGYNSLLDGLCKEKKFDEANKPNIYYIKFNIQILSAIFN
jgi:hypothetical protein